MKYGSAADFGTSVEILRDHEAEHHVKLTLRGNSRTLAQETVQIGKRAELATHEILEPGLRARASSRNPATDMRSRRRRCSRYRSGSNRVRAGRDKRTFATAGVTSRS